MLSFISAPVPFVIGVSRRPPSIPEDVIVYELFPDKTVALGASSGVLIPGARVLEDALRNSWRKLQQENLSLTLDNCCMTQKVQHIRSPILIVDQQEHLWLDISSKARTHLCAVLTQQIKGASYRSETADTPVTVLVKVVCQVHTPDNKSRMCILQKRRNQIKSLYRLSWKHKLSMYSPLSCFANRTSVMHGRKNFKRHSRHCCNTNRG